MAHSEDACFCEHSIAIVSILLCRKNCRGATVFSLAEAVTHFSYHIYSVFSMRALDRGFLAFEITNEIFFPGF